MTHSDDDCSGSRCGGGGSYEMQTYSAGPERSSNEMPEVAGRDRLDFRMGGQPSEPPTDMMESSMPAVRVSAEGGRHIQSSNTGPKGVKEDYKEAQRNLRTQRLMTSIATQRQLQQQAGAHRQALPDTEIEETEQARAAPPPKAKDSDDESDDSLCSDDESMLHKLRQQRITAYQSSLPEFGTYDRLESKKHLTALVQQLASSGVHLVVHLYQNTVPRCIQLNLALESLCRTYRHVCFARIRSTDCIPGYSDAGLPTLTVYRQGKMLTSAVRCTDVLSADVTDQEVAKLLQAKGFLAVPTGVDLFKSVHDDNDESQQQQQQQQQTKRPAFTVSRVQSHIDSDSD